MTLLFVCTGNTCRSPLAVAAWEAWGAPLLSGTPHESRVRAFSAGLSAAPGALISPHAARVAQEWGVDLARHRARSLAPGFAARADWCLAMTPAHRAALQLQLARPERALLLGEFARGECSESDRLMRLLGESTDARDGCIEDPIGGSLEAYQACGARLRLAVEGLARAVGSGALCS